MAPKALPSRNVPTAVMKMMVPRVVKSKASTSTPAANTALSTPLEMVPCEFPVTLSLQQSAVLGAELDASDGKTLLVRAVTGGAFGDWNRLHPLLAIQKGDRIVAVNHRNADAQAMLMEIRVAGILRMLVRSFRKQSQQSLLLSGATGFPLPLQPEESKKRPADSGDSLYGNLPAPDPEKKVQPTKDIFADPPAKEDPSLAIFLDIDGVLRKLESVPTITVNGGTLPLDLGNRALLPEALRALKYLIHLTGASIIISSEWRRSSSLLEEAQTALRALGMRVRGVTPVLRPREDLFVGSKLDPDKQATLRLRWAERRAREITSWLQEHREVRHWLALDDLDLTIADEASIRSSDTLKMGPCLVLVDPEVGMTMSHARQSSEWLARKERPRKMART